MKRRFLKINRCGYVRIKEDKNWPHNKITGAGRPERITGKVSCRKVNDVYQVVGKQGFDIIDDEGIYYAYVGKQYAGQKAYVEYDLPAKSRKLKVDACGYLVISQTKNYPHNKLLKVNNSSFNVNNLYARFESISCSNHTIGNLQGYNFAYKDKIYVFMGFALSGTAIDIEYSE